MRGWPSQGHTRSQPSLSQRWLHEGAAEAVLTPVSVSSGTSRYVVSNPVCLQVLLNSNESQQRGRIKKKTT